MVAKILVLALIVSTASAAVWMEPLPKTPDAFQDKKGCFIKEIYDVISFDTTIRPIGHCYRITCTEVILNYASCGAVFTTDPKCHVTEKDLTRPYPECCPRIKCDSDNKVDRH